MTQLREPDWPAIAQARQYVSWARPAVPKQRNHADNRDGRMPLGSNTGRVVHEDQVRERVRTEQRKKSARLRAGWLLLFFQQYSEGAFSCLQISSLQSVRLANTRQGYRNKGV
jgi:hypothetical protein